MNWMTWFGGLFFGFGIGFAISAWRSRRMLRQLEQDVSAPVRACRVMVAQINASFGLANSLLDAFGSMSNVVQGFGEITLATMECWNRAMTLVSDERYYDAVQEIAADQRVKANTFYSHLIQTLYLIATKKKSADAERIKAEFPYVTETLKPFPVLPPLKQPLSTLVS
jgi:hypothetical protein